jgi:urease accessory protein
LIATSLPLNSLLTLLQVNDSMFPIGGFTQSYGLESYINEALVKDVESAKAYTRAMLLHNIYYNDGAFVNKAWHCAAGKKLIWNKISELDALVTALKAPMELSQASQKLGIRFLKLTKQLKPNPLCSKYLEAIENGVLFGHYTIAFGLYAFAEKIPIKETLLAHYYNALNGMVTNCAKMIPISQIAAQKILFDLHPLMIELVDKQNEIRDEEIGLCCIGQEIKSMQHEKLYSRIYIS